MANRRTFNAQALVSNGVALGGLSQLGLESSYRDVIASSPDGAFGAEDVDRAGLAVAASLTCSDVTKAAALLGATPASTAWSEKVSGSNNWQHYTIDGVADAQVLWSGMNLNFAKNADGTLNVSGLLRFLAGAKTMADVLAIVSDAIAPTLVFPARLYRPKTASFDPDGVAPAIAPIHVESLQLSLTGSALEEYGDADIGMTGVDLTGWQPLQVTLGFKDAGSDGGTSVIGAALVDAGRGVLTVGLAGRAGAADQTLTINNLLPTAYGLSGGSDYSSFTLKGQCGWRNAGVAYDFTGTPLFAFA